MENWSFPAEKSFFDHALSSMTVLQLQHACESHTMNQNDFQRNES